jgi:hypothetical protein
MREHGAVPRKRVVFVMGHIACLPALASTDVLSFGSYPSKLPQVCAGTHVLMYSNRGLVPCLGLRCTFSCQSFTCGPVVQMMMNCMLYLLMPSECQIR